MKTKTLPQFHLVLPTLTTRKVWAGIYSEMTGTFVILWNTKPTKDKTLGYYHQDKSAIAVIDIDMWEFWFNSVQAFVDADLISYKEANDMYVATSDDLECHEVIQIELTAPWTTTGQLSQLIGLDIRAD